jgi:hypothetical protein
VRSRTRALLLVMVLALATLAPAGSSGASIPDAATPVLGPPVMTQSQMVAWYRANVPANRPLRAGNPSVSIGTLVRYYYEEGAKEGVRPDLAFLMGLHETAWFNFPAGGCVRPEDHNYAGIGAFNCDKHLNEYGLPAYVWRFDTVRQGVRAHLQYLRAYADRSVSSPSDLGSAIPNVSRTVNGTTTTFPQQWQWIVSTWRVNNGGPWPVYDQYGAGIWAADPLYWPKIRNYIERALTFNGYPANAATQKVWHLRNTNTGGNANSRAFLGTPGAEYLACDWNGNGRDTPGVFKDGVWQISNNRDGSAPYTTFNYGRRGDFPLCGDWNGNGRETVGIVRDGTWHLKNSLAGGSSDISFKYGRITRGDIPIVGDWNGNGIATPGIIRDREWHLRNSHSGGPGQTVFIYGRLTRGDKPLVGDWNGDGRDSPGIVREREWHLRNARSGGNANITFIYGRVTAGDVPLMGDWTGNGIDTPAIIR